MSALAHGVDLLVNGAPIALAGATVLLLLGVVAGWRSGPALRQRIAEVSVACAVVWAVLAIAPLPRVPMPTRFVAEAAIPQGHAADERDRWVLQDRPEAADALEVRHSEIAPDTRESTAALHLAANPPNRGATAIEPVSEAEAIIRSPARNPTTEGVAPKEAPAWPATSRDSRSIASGRGWVAAWMIGAALVSVWLLIGLVRVVVTLRRSTPVDVGEDLPPGCRAARVLATDQPVRPFCFGVRRPVIVIPRSILTGDPSIRRSVLHHEAVHYARRDGVGQLVFAVAWPLFFFHPLLWILRRRARFAAEILADDGAVQGRARRAYAKDLLRLAEASLRPAPAASIAAAMTRSSSELTRRIEMLMQPSVLPLAARCSRSSRWLIAGAAAFALVPSALVFGARPSPPPEIVDAQDGEAAAELAALRKDREALQVALEDLQRKLDQVMRERVVDQASPEAPRPELPADPLRVSGGFGGGGEPQLVEVVVQRGDTLHKIWMRLTGRSPDKASLEDLRRLNPEMEAETLHVGQRLRVRRALLTATAHHDPFAADTARGPGGGLPGEPPAPDAADPLTGSPRANPSKRDAEWLGSIDPTILEALVQRIDIAAEMDIAKNELVRLSRMAEHGVVPQEELIAADARSRALKSKARLYDALVEMEIETTARRIENQKQVIIHDKKLVEKGFLPRSSLADDEALLHRLEGQLMILGRDF